MKYRLSVLAVLLILSVGFTWAQQDGRKTIKINQKWSFKKETEKTEQTINLPHTWNNLDALDEEPGFFRGLGIYNKTLHINNTEDRCFFLYFEGAATIAKVYCNDVLSGNHIGSYGSFAVDITSAVSKGANTIRVEVDNSYHENVPPLSADFTFMGGLYRNVFLVETGEIHFDMENHGANGVSIFMPTVTKGLAKLNIEERLFNHADKKKSVRVSHKLINSQSKQLGEVVAKQRWDNRDRVLQNGYELQVENPELWSPNEPSLYRLVSELKDTKTGEVYDRVVNTVGFRWFDYSAENGLSLNGEPIKLKGVNRTQDHSEVGIALPDEYHLNDLKMIKEAGFNSIRLGHYQQSPVVLEACNRLGFIVTCEVPLIDEITLSDEFSDNILNMLLDLVRRDVNHPSIMAWGLSNEILLRMPKGSKEEKNAYRDYLKNLLTNMDSLVEKEDPYRPSMSVMHLLYAMYKRAKIHNIGDIAAINLYPGWYSGTPDQMEKIARTMYDKAPEKPFFITEYGAGGDPRLRSDKPQPFDFSLEYQLAMHKHWYNTISTNDFMSGSFAWVFSDFASEKRGDSEPKINSKGLVSFDRIPKDVYYYYQAVLNEKPIVNIGIKNWRFHTGIEDVTNKSVCHKNVEIYSNLPQVEIIFNGQSQGLYPVESHTVSCQLAFINGVNTITALGKTKDGRIVTDRHQINFNLIPNNLKESHDHPIEIRVNAGSNCYFLDKEEKAVWLPGKTYSENGFGFIGGEHLITNQGRKNRIGTNYDIIGTDDDPLYQTQHISPDVFRADVPEGLYDVSIGLADLYKKGAKKLAYELAGEDKEQATLSLANNEFSLYINGELIFEDVNPRKQVGETTSLELTSQIYTTGGIEINFKTAQGISYVNTIKIIKK